MEVIKKLIGGGLVLLVVSMVLGLIFMETINPNQVGVFQYRPFVYGKSSVDGNIMMGPERAYMWPSTKLWKVDTAPQTLTAHAEDFMTADRVPLDFDLAITIRVINLSTVPDMIRKFGATPAQVFSTLVLQQGDDPKKPGAPTGELMSYLRDQVRHHPSSVFIAAQTPDGQLSDGAADVERQTRAHINAFLAQNGAGMIQVDNIALGRANPPPGVRESIDQTAKEAQDSKTQVERRKAASEREATEAAVARADRVYVSAMGLSTDQFVQLQALRTYREVCKPPTVCIFSTSQVPMAMPVQASAPVAAPLEVKVKK